MEQINDKTSMEDEVSVEVSISQDNIEEAGSYKDTDILLPEKETKWENKQRNFEIDLYRFIGMSSIILAHVYGYEILNLFYKLRTFDVRLLVYVSGMSFCVSRGTKANMIQHFIARFKRLILPTWTYITILYFIVFPIIGNQFERINKKNKMFSFYKLDHGFWLIRLILITSLFSPFYKRILALPPRILCLCCCLAMLGVYYAILFKVITEPILEVISYGILFILGYLYQMGRKDVYIYAVLSFTAMIFLKVYSVSQLEKAMWQSGKMADLFCTLWGVIICALLCFMVEILELKKVPDSCLKSFITFVSTNTIWIFFWHLPMARYNFVQGLSNDPLLTVLVNYLITYLVPVTGVMFQRLLIEFISRTRFKWFNELMITVFTG